MKNKTSVVFAGLAALAIVTAPAQTTLWYNGDLNNDNALRDTLSASSAIDATVYDDFTVPVASGGWQVTEVFGNLIFSGPPGITNANWSIRSGVSDGNGGTVVASGANAAITVTPTGRNFSGVIEYKVDVAGLSISLSPGTYWLGVQAVTDNPGYMTTTSGANGVGTPLDDDNAFFNSPSQGANFELQPPSPRSGSSDYSMGIVGAVVSGVSPIPLHVQQSGANLVLNWTDSLSAFSLQAASAITGNFTNVPGATSPYTNAIAGTQMYFRLKSN